MGDLLFPDFQTKDRRYTKGGGIDDLDLPTRPGMDQLIADSWLETAPCEMPPVQPMYEAPERDGA
jgi:hypothetical protein